VTLDEVYQALRADIVGGAIDLVTAATGDLAALATPLHLLQLATTFPVSNAVLTQPVNQVLLRGTARYGLPGAQASGGYVVDVSVSLAVTLDEAANAVFNLTLFLPPQTWRFSDTFAALPDSQQLAQDGQTVTLAPSFLIGLPLLDASLAANSLPGASAQLSGDLPQAGVFALPAYSGLFPGRWPLSAAGPVTLPASYNASPDLELMAIVGGSALPFGDTSLIDLGFTLSIQTGFDPNDYGYSAVSNLELTGRVQFDAEHSLRLVLGILTVQTSWRLLVLADPDTIRIGDQIERVAALLGLSVAELISPETLDTFNAFYLAEIEIWLPAYQGSLLDGLGAAAFDVSHIGVTLKSDRVWNPPIPFCRIIDTGMRWDIGWMAGSDGKPEMFTFGSVFGGINIGTPDPEVAKRPAARSLPLLSAPHPAMRDERVPVDEGDDDGPILADTFTVDLAGYIPSFVLEGRLRTNQEIPIGYAFNQFFGNPGPPTKDQMRITAFGFLADPYRLTFQAEAVVAMNWSIPFTNTVSLDLIELRFNIDVRQSSVGGSISGTLQLTGGAIGDAQPQFTVSATYVPSTRAGEWTFRGFLNQNAPLELVTLIANLLTDDPPANLPALNVERMAIEFGSVSQSYSVAGSILARWQFAPFGTSLTVSARAEAAIARPNAQTSPSGYLAGSFQVNRIGLYASRDIGVEFPTYTFRVYLGDQYLSAQTAWVGEGQARHQTITLRLSSITLGEILEYLVNLAAPTLGYHLSPPWDLLNKIDLSRFTLTIDPTEQTAALTYDVLVDLTIFRVDRIGVKYTRKQGEGSVDLILEGAALGQDYSGDDALAWDVINDNPPDLVPENAAVVDLRYMAFGQHVKISGIDQLDTVRAVLLHMEQAMQPVKSDQSPIGQPGAAGVEFAADSQWLIGLDIGIAGFIDLGLIFNDPRLYGLSISLSGADAGALSDLYFEILYKKITDSLGMFRVELQVPEAFRHLEFGEVSITLGVVVVEVYTNGNFKIDLGFPYARNFSRSFSVEVFPFLGRGGIYFGLLDGDSSRRVPVITNGFFAPVIELGVGLAVGVGKDFSVGILSAGAYIELEVILEGVFARFLPASSGQDTALYYWVRGIAALHGKIYGTVDFVVIKVNVTLEASASVALTLEAYQASLVELNVDVSANASVKILFITVSFSFQVSVAFDFTIGSASTTPWILAPSQPPPPTSEPTRLARRAGPAPSTSLYRLHRGRRDLRRALLRSAHLRRLYEAGVIVAPATPRALLRARAGPRRGKAGALLACGAGAAATLNWDPHFLVFDDSPRTIPLILLPAFSCDAVILGWTTPPSTASDDYQIVLQLWAETGAITEPKTIADSYRRDVSTSAHADDVTEMPAAELVEAFLRWAIYAVTNPAGGTAAATVTAGALAQLADEMAAGGAATQTAFTFATLDVFLGTNVRLSVSGSQDAGDLSAMPVALPPLFNFAWTGAVTGSVDLAVFNQVGPAYIADVAAYQRRFTATPAQSASPPDGPADTVSFASHMFSDWCLMIARAAVDEAQKQLAQWELRPQAATSLSALAEGFASTDVSYAVRTGDTVDSVALALGATSQELVYLNPTLAEQLGTAPAGSELSILLGVAPEVIALDNADRNLAAGTYSVDHIGYQARTGDTLAGIAGAFGLAGATSLLSDPALASNPSLLQTGSSFTTPATHYDAPNGFGALQSAAFLYARFGDTQDVPDRQWYLDLILFWNAEALKAQPVDGAFAPGLPLKLPTALNDLTEPAQANYTTQVGDTAARIAAMADLAQNYGTGPADAVPGWATWRDAMIAAFAQVTDGVSPPVLIPTQVTILPGESLNALAERSYIFGDQTGHGVANLAGVVGWIAAAPVLAVHAGLRIDGFVLNTSVYPSLAAVSQALGLDVAALAGQLADDDIVPALAKNDPPWIVTDVPVVAVDELVTLVLAGKGFTNITSQSSRQLMAGLRLPGPVAGKDGVVRATGPMTALAGLSGQQLAGPPPGDGTDPAIDIVAKLDSGATWISLVDSTVGGGGETRAALAARAPAALAVNRRLVRTPDAAPPPGAILQLAAVDQLTFSYTPAQLTALYPAGSLTVTPVSGPAALPLSTETPATYGLSNRIELQVTSLLPIPVDGTAPKTGNPSLWPFSSEVQALALAGTATPYEIVKSASQGTTGGEAETVLSSTFGTLFSIKIKTLPGSQTLYQLLGTDDVQRQTLLQLWRYLAGKAAPSLSVFVAPDPSGANVQGLAQVAVDQALSTIVKTNLSTQTVPGLPPPQSSQTLAARDEGDDEPIYGAAMASPGAFLKLLWEGVSVGGAGYYLNLQVAGGVGLPATIFTGEGEAYVRFVVVVAAQQGSTPAGRPLLAFNSCALIGPGLDAAASTVYLEAADDSDMTRVATVPQGNAGISLVTPMAPQVPVTPADRTLQLYSIVSYSVGAAGQTFYANRPGMPITPEAKDDPNVSALAKRRLARQARARGLALDDPEPTNWSYVQVFPIAQMGPPSSAPAVAGLPPPAADPYRGINTGSSLPSANLAIGFNDIFGNTTTPQSGGPGSFALPVGYTDTLVTFDNWPGLALGYSLAAGDVAGTVDIVTGFAAQSGALMPGLGMRPESAVLAAQNQADTYQGVYYQLAQPSLTLTFVSTLYVETQGQSAAQPKPVDLSGQLPALWRFAAASLLYARAVAQLDAARPLAAGPQTVAALAATYGLTPEALGAGQSDQRAYDILGGQTLTIPGYLPFAENQTAAALVAGAPPGWPRPATGAALLALPKNAEQLPLRPGLLLAIPDRTVVVPSGDPVPSLAAIAASVGSTAPLLGEDNAANPNILTGGVTLLFDGLTVTTVAPGTAGVRSFADIVGAFGAQGVIVFVGDIGAQLADRTGTLVAGSSMIVKRYLVPLPTEQAPYETLASNGSGASVADLAADNADTPNVFDTGALVYLGDFGGGPAAQPSATTTLTEFCNQYGTTPAALFAALTQQSPASNLPAGEALTVPGMLALPQNAGTLRIPCPVRATDTLTAIAARFAYAGDALNRLGLDNEAMPNLFVAGQTVAVLVSGTSYQTTTVAGDGIGSVLARLQAQLATIDLDQLMAAIGPQTGLLAQGALLSCPPAVMPDPSNSGALTPNAAAATFGIEAAAFLAANAAMKGLLKAGVTISGPGQTPVTVETAAQDTAVALLARLAAAGAQLDVAQLVSINGDVAFLAAAALALLPPAPLAMSVAAPAAAGPFAAPVQPLDVSLTLARPASRIDPSFAAQGAGGVEAFTARIGSPVSPSGAGGGAGVDQNTFGAQLATLFPTLRLITGRVAGTAGELWFLPFDPSGVDSLTVEGVFDPPSGLGDKWPRYFALRPLYANLVSLEAITLPVLNPDGTLGQSPTPSNLAGLDVEPMALRVLQDIDQFLSAQYGGPVYADPQAQAALLAVIKAKRILAPAVANGLAPVFAQTDSGVQPALRAAAVELGQALAQSLAQGYAVSTVLQYVSACVSAWTDQDDPRPGARLLGQVAAPTGPASSGLQYSITAAKTRLDRASDYVTFLLTLNDPAHAQEIALALGYGFSNLEFDIQSIPVGAGVSYEASDWLAFTPALASDAMPPGVSTKLGQVQVPIPNRAFPQIPTLRSQTVGRDPVATLAEAALWTYALRYAHEHASQDDVHLEIQFNRPPSQSLKQAETPDALAKALVSYSAVAAGLWDLLGYYADPTRGDAQTAAAAAASFAELVGTVATTWAAHWPALAAARLAEAALVAPDPLPGLPPAAYGFEIALNYAVVEQRVVTVSVDVSCGTAGPGPSGAWPALVLRDADGLPVTTTRTDVSLTQSLYTLERVIPAASYADLTLEWAEIPLALYQNAAASLMVTRNGRLSPNYTTNPDFIFSTDLVNAASTVTPINTDSMRFDITNLGADLGSALTAAFQTLFGATTYIGQPVTLGLSYGFELLPGTEGAEPLVTYLPIALYPDQELANTTGATIQGAVDTWIGIEQPVRTGGEIVVSLSLYSQIQGQERLALLVLERLVYRLSSG
jgi:hypothetical protein